MREIDQRATPEATQPRPALSWLALGAALLIVVLLARTLIAYPLVPLRLSLGGSAPPAPTLVTTQQNSGVPNLNLQNVVMLSATDGWAIGSNDGFDPSTGAYQFQPLLLYWNGVDWSSVANLPGDGGISALAALPGGYLWLAEGNTIYQYLGGSWYPASVGSYDPSSDEYTNISTIDMLSPSEGWAAGYVSNSDGETGTILRYHDGGWTPQMANAPPASTGSSVLRGLSMARDGSEGWAVGSRYSFSGEVPYALHYANGAWAEADAGLPGGLTAVATVAPGDAWATGITSGTGPGYIAHWQHGAWLHVVSPTTNQLHAITMLGPDEGDIAGDGAATLRYTDGAWQREGLVIHGTQLSGISMTAPGEGWAVGGPVMLREHHGAWSVYHLSL
jgi:hypothetical protein